MSVTPRPAAANRAIQTRLVALLAAGLTPIDALRVVVGPALVDALIDRLYVALRTGVQL